MVALARRWWMFVLLLLLALVVLLWWAWAARNQTPPSEQPTASVPTASVPTASVPTASANIIATAAPSTPTPASTPTAAPTPVPSPLTTACPEAPAPRWADTLYAQFAEQLGCPVTAEISITASEIPASGAFQYFERGTMIWRQHADIIYVIYDDGTYVAFPDDSPPNYYESDFLKGGFGYLWNNNEDVSGLIGNPLTIEYAAADFALQDFTSGTILYFFDQISNHYLLFVSPTTWILRQE